MFEILQVSGIAVANAFETLINIWNSTVFQTVVTGTLVFTLGQMVKDFLLSPIKSYKKTVGEIDNKLKYHENILLNNLPADIVKESLVITRSLSCDLESNYKQIPFLPILIFIGVIPTRGKVSDAGTKIIRLSNVGGQEKYLEKLAEDLDDIRKNLNIQKL